MRAVFKKWLTKSKLVNSQISNMSIPPVSTEVNFLDILSYIRLICQCGKVVGKMETTHPTQNVQMSAFRDIMKINLEGNFRNQDPLLRK